MPLPGEHSLYSRLAVPLFTSSSSLPLKASISCTSQQNSKLFHWHNKQRSPILRQNKTYPMTQTPVHTEFCLTPSDNFVRQVGELEFNSAWISVTRETCVWLTKINYSQYALGWAGVYVFFHYKMSMGVLIKIAVSRLSFLKYTYTEKPTEIFTLSPQVVKLYHQPLIIPAISVYVRISQGRKSQRHSEKCMESCVCVCVYVWTWITDVMRTFVYTLSLWGPALLKGTKQSVRQINPYSNTQIRY